MDENGEATKKTGRLKLSNFRDVFFWVSDMGVQLRRNMACRL